MLDRPLDGPDSNPDVVDDHRARPPGDASAGCRRLLSGDERGDPGNRLEILGDRLVVLDVEGVRAFEEQDDLHYPGGIDVLAVDQGDLVR